MSKPENSPGFFYTVYVCICHSVMLFPDSALDLELTKIVLVVVLVLVREKVIPLSIIMFRNKEWRHKWLKKKCVSIVEKAFE